MAGQRSEGLVRVADGLGWFSNALAVAQLGRPRGFARAIGTPDGDTARTIVRLVGAREAAAGAGILARPRPVGWMWARVAGDIMDLALLGIALRSKKAQPARIAGAAATVVGVTAVDALVARRLGQQGDEPPMAREAVTVNRSPQEVYEFWRALENLPRFMTHLESVETLGEGRSRWRAKGPLGKTVEWDAETTEDRPGERIAWRSLPGSTLDNSGAVTFRPAPGDRGTEVVAEIRYEPPAGGLGATAAKILGADPNAQFHDDLRRFKQVIETGDIVRSEGSPEGHSLAQHLKQRAAQPLERETTEGTAS